MAWETVSNYYSGQGVVLMGTRVKDLTTGIYKAGALYPVGNCSALKLAVNTSTVEHKETTTGARAIDLRLTTEVKANLEVDIENFNGTNLSRAMRGNTVIDPTTYDAATKTYLGTVTGSPLTVYLGAVVPLDHIKVNTVVVKKGAATLIDRADAAQEATETLRNTWDYELNEVAGSIQWVDPIKYPSVITTVLEGDAVTVGYSFLKQEEVHGLTQPTQTVWLRFEGLNTAAETGATEGYKPVVLDVFKFSTDPLKELELIGDKVSAFALAGTVLADLSQGSGVSKYWRLKLLS